jgi:ABC-type antimicrobial peptide transport system permease subunit
MFNNETLISKLSGVFSSLAIFISCLGLFGLAAFTAERRTKEIGIRKVLGASIPQVWLLLSRDFLLLVILSCGIASPIAGYILGDWLMKYEYRIHIGPGVFLLAGGMALAITVITVSFQALMTATANPVKALRSE